MKSEPSMTNIGLAVSYVLPDNVHTKVQKTQQAKSPQIAKQVEQSLSPSNPPHRMSLLILHQMIWLIYHSFDPRVDSFKQLYLNLLKFKLKLNKK